MKREQAIEANPFGILLGSFDTQWRVVWCIPEIIDNLLYEWQALATGKLQKKFWQTLLFGVAWGI